MRLDKGWNEDKTNSAVRIIGLLVSALTLFMLIASLSYLFSWKEDMSLLGEQLSVEESLQIKNAAGKLGHRLGYMLVCELFGLGSFSLLIILAAISVRLLLRKWHYSLLKTGLVALFGAVISSFLFAYCGSLLSLPFVFGGGLGGRCGAWVVKWASSLFGPAVTGLFILILIAAFLFFSSSSFTRWFASLGQNKAKKVVVSPDTNSDVQISEDEKVEPEAPVEPSPSESIENVTDFNPPIEEQREIESEGDFKIVDSDVLDAKVIEDLKPIDNRLDPPDGLPKYHFPSLELLQNYNTAKREVTTAELTRNNNKIRAALANYKIQITNVQAIVGPTVTLYKVTPAPGVKIAEIKRLQEDIGLSLNAKGVRVVVLSDSVGIEVANDYSSTVALKSLLNDAAFRDSKADLPVAIGFTITQKVKVFDLASAPHLLIAGATQQGKSVGLNVIISSLLFCKHPSELKFVFIDPKMVEFSAYNQLLKHYLAVLPDSADEDDEKANAIVKKPKDAEKILRSLCTEMDNRYELMSKAGVNKVTLYNERYKARKLRPDKGHKYMPYLVVVVDEYADLTMMSGASSDTRATSRSISSSIIRLAQKGRAAGLHVILATQRPSVDVVSSQIKGNFPMRIAFRVASRVDSMTIIDTPGAEKLIGKGDMLFSAGIDSERIQCGYISGDEIDDITQYIGSQNGYGRCYNTPYYLPSVADSGDEGSDTPGAVDMSKLDERFEEAAKMVVINQKGSTSDLQRRLGMGYAKAGKVMDQLEAAGIVGPQEGSKPRQVLVPDLNTLQPILDAYLKK